MYVSSPSLFLLKVISKGPEPCITLPPILMHLSKANESSFLYAMNSTFPSPCDCGVQIFWGKFEVTAIFLVFQESLTPAMQLVEFKQTNPLYFFFMFILTSSLGASGVLPYLMQSAYIYNSAVSSLNKCDFSAASDERLLIFYIFFLSSFIGIR